MSIVDEVIHGFVVLSLYTIRTHGTQSLDTLTPLNMGFRIKSYLILFLFFVDLTVFALVMTKVWSLHFETLQLTNKRVLKQRDAILKH